jgi:hypothetical protein
VDAFDISQGDRPVRHAEDLALDPMRQWPNVGSWDTMAVLMGFALTLVSLVGGQIYLTPSLQAISGIDREIATRQARMRITRNALALDDFAKQLGGALFLVKPASPEGTDGAQTIHVLKNRALLQRHDGVRAAFASLGLAGEVDFTTVSGAYDALVDAELRDFTLETFQAANSFDAELTTKAVKDEGADRLRITALQRLRVPSRAEAAWRDLAMILASSLGGAFLLVATLKATVHAPPTRAAPSDPQQAAIELLADALSQTHARIAKARSAAA